MRLGLFAYMSDSQGSSPIDAYVQEVRAARDEGFTSVWSPQLPWEQDLVVTLAVALREVDGVTLGSAVIPIQSRLPMVMAQQALTLSLLSGGRFRLGIGLTHAVVSESMWGIPWDRPVRRLNEFLDGLLPLLDGEPANAVGQLTTTRGALRIARAPAPPVYVAALGPQLLKVAGRRTAGTVTWMVGPKTLASHIVPTLRAAASEAGRQAEVVAGFPVCVTDDVAGTRAYIAETMHVYGTVPSYRAMLDREGVDGPADLALIGNENAVAEQIEAIAAIGIDEFGAAILQRDPQDVARTRAFLRTRL
jgi:F420-dependent oxidoreductase-like protein